MRIDELAVLICGANAVRIAVGAKAAVAAVGHYRLAQGADVRLDGLGVDAGEERVDVAANLHVGYADAGKNVGNDGAAGAIHRVDGEFHAGFCERVKAGKALNGFEVGGQEIDLLDCGGLRGTGGGLAQARLDLGDDRGLARPAVPRFVLDPVPLRRIVRGGNHDAAGRRALAHAEAERRGGRHIVGQQHRNAGGGHNFSAGARKGPGAEARVVADAQTPGGVFFRCTFAGVYIGCHGLGGNAHIGEGEIVGNHGTPAVCAELDLRMRHR